MTQNSIGVSIPVPVNQGGTNSTTAAAALAALGAVPLAGGTMTGLLVLSADPSAALGAATKQYVDTIASGLDFKDACYATTTAALTVVYANGAAGVGATLTNAGAMAAFSIDSVSPPLNSRVLIKNQASPLQNGIYTVTVVGSGAVNWVLTRATDFDTPAEIPAGAWTIINNGAIYATSSWVQTATVTTIGVDAITFSQFTAGVGANTSLSNLITTSINQDLIPDGIGTRDLGTGTNYWQTLYLEQLGPGQAAAASLTMSAYDVDGAAYTPFITFTSNNTPTCAFSGSITSVTQSLGTDDTRLATTAFVQDAIDDLALDKANIQLNNLASVAINTTLVSDTDLADDLGTQAIRWDQVFAENLCTGDTNGDVLTLSGWDVDGSAYVEFITVTAADTPTCVIAGSVTGTTQAALDNSTKLATTAYVDSATGGGAGANAHLSNLTAVAINTTLVSDTDVTDNLGTQAIRWNNIYAATLQTGDTATDTLQIGAWDVDGAAFVPFFTCTAANTPTGVLSGSVTGTTQAANTNNTTLATTAYADASSGARANVALSNLSGVAINTSLLPGTDNSIDAGDGTHRYRQIYSAGLTTGTTAADTLIISARDVDGASNTAFITLTAGNTPTCVLASAVTGTTQAPADNSTKLATTAYADAVPGTVSANKALSNLASVAINTSLLPGSDNAIDLGTGILRFRAAYLAQLKTGTTATDTLVISARDVDGASDTAFITLTAGNTPTCAIAGATITGGTIASLASPIAVASGGTGVATFTTAYGTVCAGTTATGALQTVSPGTAGNPLVSGGSAALPSYTTLGVAGGGTGVATLTTAYGVLCAGTTATGAVQTLASLGTSGHVLTSNGAGALPSFQAAGGGASAATQAQMEAATSTTTYASPGRTQYHPGVAKSWVNGNVNGTSDVSYNVSSLTDVATGRIGVSFSTAFSSADYVALGTSQINNTLLDVQQDTANLAAGRSDFAAINIANAYTDPTEWNLAFFGDQ